nr:serpin family protein [Oriental turtle dovepox virus]
MPYDPRLHVSEMKQKSVIKVNESGVEVSSRFLNIYPRNRN